MQINMTTANLTGDGPQKTVEQLDCSSGLSAGLHGHLQVFFSFKLVPFRYYIFWECFDPSCSSSGVFPPSTVQTLAS